MPAHSDAEPAEPEPEPASGPDPQPNAESAPQAEPRHRPGRGHAPAQDQVGSALRPRRDALVPDPGDAPDQEQGEQGEDPNGRGPAADERPGRRPRTLGSGLLPGTIPARRCEGRRPRDAPSGPGLTAAEAGRDRRPHAELEDRPEARRDVPRGHGRQSGRAAPARKVHEAQPLRPPGGSRRDAPAARHAPRGPPVRARAESAQAGDPADGLEPGQGLLGPNSERPIHAVAGTEVGPRTDARAGAHDRARAGTCAATCVCTGTRARTGIRTSTHARAGARTTTHTRASTRAHAGAVVRSGSCTATLPGAGARPTTRVGAGGIVSATRASSGPGSGDHPAPRAGKGPGSDVPRRGRVTGSTDHDGQRRHCRAPSIREGPRPAAPHVSAGGRRAPAGADRTARGADADPQASSRGRAETGDRPVSRSRAEGHHGGPAQGRASAGRRKSLEGRAGAVRADVQ